MGFYFELEVRQSSDPLDREKVPLDKERILLLVVQGFTQTYGVDYDQTFSAVVKFESIRTVLCL